MAVYTNSFSIDVPEFEATVYAIDPQPRGSDPWKPLGAYEGVLRGKVNGSVQRYFRNGEWYLLAIGADTRVDEVRTDDGTALSLYARHTPDFSKRHDQKPVVQALRDGVTNYLIWVRDFWRFGRTSRYYESEYSRVIDGYRAYDGYDVRVAHQDGFYLTANPKTKFASDKTLYEWIQDIGAQQVEVKFEDRNFFFETEKRPTVRFVSVSRSETISDKTIPDDDGPISIIKYAEKNDFPEHVIEQFDPSEPVVKVQYSWSDEPVSAAPSMLRATPEKLTGRMTGYSAKDADDRWTQTKAFVESIQYLKMGDVVAPVSDGPRTVGVGQFEYPQLSFGADGQGVLSTGADFASGGSRTVTPDSWDRAKTDYLSEYGPRKKPRGSPSVALFHQTDLEADARDAYDDVRDYLDRYMNIPLAADPGIQAYDDRRALRRWVTEYGDSTTAALAYLGEYTDDYYDIIEAFDGKPVQQLTHQTYRQAPDAGEFSDSLYNIAVALAVKMDARPYLLTHELSADAIIGLSVTGDEQNTATGVLVAGDSGNLIWQTEERRGTGNKTVAPERIAERILEEALQAGTESPEIDPMESVLVHRSGTFGDDEEAAVRTMVEAFQDGGGTTDTLDWCVVEVQENDQYRIFDDSRTSHVCDTGAYARLDDETVAVATWAHPLIHQGTPKNLLCEVEASEGNFDIEAIGRDVFHLSFLNWGAPQMKIKHPITTYLPSEMHDILEKCPKLQYPPF